MTEWIEWNGGAMPVSPTTECVFTLRMGAITAPYTAEKFRWSHRGGPGDIVRYAVADNSKTDGGAWNPKSGGY